MTRLAVRRLRRTTTLLALLGLIASATGQLVAQNAQPAGAQERQSRAADPDRWEATIKKFEDQDKIAPPPQNAVVFVGASSIVRWNLPESFPDLGPKAINRGFGGSLMPDSTRYADRIVIPYKPRLVVLYAGDNDVEANRTPQQIFDDFTAFERKVHAALPQTRIIFISIKPSIRRWAWIEQIKAANAMVERYCASNPNLTFVDIVPQMIGPDGMPRKDLLVADGLHLSPEGYKVWNAALRPLLQIGQTN
jgi:lysophospholipase L1-like esterase